MNICTKTQNPQGRCLINNRAAFWKVTRIKRGNSHDLRYNFRSKPSWSFFPECYRPGAKPAEVEPGKLAQFKPVHLAWSPGDHHGTTRIPLSRKGRLKCLTQNRLKPIVAMVTRRKFLHMIYACDLHISFCRMLGIHVFMISEHGDDGTNTWLWHFRKWDVSILSRTFNKTSRYGLSWVSTVPQRSPWVYRHQPPALQKRTFSREIL